MYTPLLPGSSITSWLYLKDSRAAQLNAFSQDGLLRREQQNFAAKIGKMSSVDDLMKDYQALKVALGAHGLKDDLPNRYFIRQVIEQGTDDPGDFANKLSDGRYAALAKTFEALGLTGSGDLSASLPALSDGLSAAVQALNGESPVYLNAAAKLSSNLTLGLLGADTAGRVWERALREPGMSNTLGRILGTSASAALLDTKGQIDVFETTMEQVYGSTKLTALIDPKNAFAVADAYLGTAGQALEAGFSYSGMKSRIDAIAKASSNDADRWAALQADTALRDVMSAALGVSAGFSGLSAADQIADMKSKAEGLFGRSEFSVFTSQANQTLLGDRYLDPDGRGLAGTFSLGAFTDAVEAARDQGPSVGQKWESVLKVEPLRDALVQGLGLGDGFGSLSQADQVAAMKAAMKAQYGTEDVAALQDPKTLAALSGAQVDAQIADVTKSYVEQEFRIAVGELRPELRVAMSLAEEMKTAVETGGTEAGQWYRVLGNSVLREAFQGAFGMGSDFASMDLDAQRSLMQAASERLIGSSKASDFLDPENQEKLITQYLVRSGTAAASYAGSSGSLFTSASASSILATIYGG
ncbi:DUF1217 domain-containing protein [Mangrovicoccus sp. HB161399]|uniref:DUF1217 domain-containing protein n=1 Tax=Mangrovicoccus sp. HB161399 TaxID=2720392 RepID=UPI0015540ED0|nr:DUF1217 domain-containing protein [Mangrovicoccus sp. HB161399]